MAMRLACYDFTVQHRAGRVHNNADGLSRARCASSPDTPTDDSILVHATHTPPTTPPDHDPDLLHAAFVAFEEDPDIHGDSHTLCFSAATEPTASTPSALGPRQLLLEAAPCSACSQPLHASSQRSLVCDRCNAAYHLRCTPRTQPPPTYWYCAACTQHIRSRGYQCPSEDIPLQHYLLTGRAPPHLLDDFRRASTSLTFTDQLYSWRDSTWKPFPPKGLQLLLMEEYHVTHSHVGGEKLYHLLAAQYFWPTLRQDCSSFVAHCFECQLSAGRSHGSWMG